MSDRLRLAALISGAGSSLAVVLDARQRGLLDLDVVEVICNKPQAPGLSLAADHGVPTRVISRVSAGAAGEDQAISDRLDTLSPDLILLTGYMRILGAKLVDRFAGRMINQHPSLLPRHKGLNTHQRAIDAGDREHGASLHFVTPELDGGPLIAQVRVPMLRGDTAQTLSDRLRPREQSLLLAVLPLFATRRLALGKQGVMLDGDPLNAPLTLGGPSLPEP
ncbi:MAG: phosphoribosylglycinamide formyltransferase [Pseudomonadota bacterium]